MRYNEESLKKIHDSSYGHPDSKMSQLSNDFLSNSYSSQLENSGVQLSLGTTAKDLEMPMPPLALAPLRQDGIR